MGTLATNLKLNPKATLDTLLADADRLDLYLVQNALTPIGDNLFVLPGPAGFMAPGWIRPNTVDQLIDFVRRLAASVRGSVSLTPSVGGSVVVGCVRPLVAPLPVPVPPPFECGRGVATVAQASPTIVS